jgi:hypothetical protein
MADVQFKSNSSAFKAMALDSEVRAACVAEAARGMEIAIGLSAPFTKTGEYVASFAVTSEDVVVSGASRAAGVLTNNAPHAAAVEWGNERDHRPHHVLGLTLEAMAHG